MADITDPEVITFNNTYMRPIAEKVRDLGVLLDEAAVEYTTNISAILAGYVDADVLVDGRLADGVTQVTKLDITNLIAHVNGIRTEVNGAGNDALRAKFTVRPII